MKQNKKNLLSSTGRKKNSRIRNLGIIFIRSTILGKRFSLLRNR